MHFKIVPAVKMFFRTSKKVHYSEFRLFASLLLTQSPFLSGEFAQSWCQNDLQSLPLKTQRPESQAAVCTVIYVWVESTFSHAVRDKGTSLQNPECVCMSVREAQNCFLSIAARIHGTGIQTMRLVTKYCSYFIPFAHC